MIDLAIYTCKVCGKEGVNLIEDELSGGNVFRYEYCLDCWDRFAYLDGYDL